MKTSTTSTTYEAILKTAYRLFAEHGFDKTSMAIIGKEIGISKPALYYHFKSKEAIIDVLFDEICKSITFVNFFSIEQYSKDNFEEKLIADGLSTIQSQTEDEYYSRIMHQYQALGYRNLKYMQKLIESLDGFTTGFHELLRHGVSIGAVKDGDTLAHAQMLTMIIDSMDNFMTYGFQCRYDKIWAKAVKSIVRGE
ncbi:TetR/AcrR family transcriptional regulator [Aneurinibacillus uraniidurans]|uniref:TetR/AcrR family transcriptional regulator n=1 Tax=Aneurinibacillus uraniidurans TaxID=2966586 RepID=UPI00234A5226|nr:TetR/AcrR family transcriptional regulator [Aneurinibacillus sp. B1]WCN36244.1 TetR/AcrR family transcriptional regulator [Aneurinibacillus sp. B1]